MCRFPVLTFVNIAKGGFLSVATKVLQQTVRKSATNFPHALDTVQEIIFVIYFPQTGRVHLDGVHQVMNLPQLAAS